MSLKNKKWIILVVLLVVVISVLVKIKSSKNKHDLKDSANTESNVVLINKSEVYTVANKSIENTLNITGDLSAKEQTIISSEVDAKVLNVLVSEGQSVKKGTVLALLDTADLAQAVMQQEAQLSAAQSQLVLNKQKMTTQEQLLKEGFVSQIAYDELVANYKSALQNYNSQMALLKRSQQQLSNTKITAPFDGVVYRSIIDAGKFVQKNTKLFAIANLSELQIKAPVPSDQISAVTVGESVVFSVENSDKKINAHVARINPVSEPGTRSYLVYIDVDNTNINLRPGQFVQGDIILERLHNKNVVDCDAIFSKNGFNYVMLINNNVINKKDVQIELKNNTTDECAINQVESGNQLVSNSVLTIKDGDKISLMSY